MRKSKHPAANPLRPVAIVGFASSSRHQTPFDNKDLEIWTMNHAPLSWIPRWDALFELHTLAHLKSMMAHQTEPNAYIDWLAKQPGLAQEGHRPIYMQDVCPEVPASVKMPREALNAWFRVRGVDADAVTTEAVTVDGKGWWADDYYTSTVSFMLALAIMQGRPKIYVYGVDLLQDEEYSYQRAGCEYLVGFARGMGIPVYIPEQSAICKANYVYGYTEPAAEGGKLEPLIKYLEDKATVSGTMVEKAKQEAHTFHGALQAFNLALGWLAEGGGKDKDGKPEVDAEGKPKDAVTLMREKRDEMDRRQRQAESAAQGMSGQTEAFKTSTVWARHFARGGALKS